MLACIKLLLVCFVGQYACERLNPLENNDKLEDINNQYVAGKEVGNGNFSSV